MGCIVFWQFSLYAVLGVLYCIALGWRCPVSVDAYTVGGQQFKPNFFVSTTNTSAPMPTSIHNNAVNETRLGRATTAMTSNKDEDSLEEQLKDDQVALKRMVTILSLVGVIGALALVATIVIFTKMRRRKQRINSKINNTLDNGDELTTDQQTTTGTGYQQRHRNSNDTHSHHSSDSTGNRSVEDETPTQNDVSIINMSINPTNTNTNTNTNISTQLRLPESTEDPQPSAPPPTAFTTTILDRHRRTLSIPLLQQSSPTPSAPTAKELDHRHQQVLENATDLHPQYHNQLGQYCHSEPASSVNTSIVATPDLPPAYTPSASPLYDRTYQSANITNTSTQLTSLRRHSQI